MQKYNFQELLSKADENIQMEKKKTEKEASKREAAATRAKKSKERSTEKLSLYIQKMIIEILTGLKSNTGVVDNLDDISKYGDIKKAEWTLDESKFQIILDFSYDIPDDVLFYTGSRGFKKQNIKWGYLCQLLQKENIIIEHNQEKRHVPEKDWYGTTYYTNVLTITLERIKKMKAEEPSALSNGPVK